MTKRRNINTDEVQMQIRKAFNFGEFCDFTNCNIIGDLKLNGGVICGCDFSGAQFLGDVLFRGVEFRGLSWFKNATFNRTTEFSDTCFANDARFDAATFSNSASFEKTEFRGVAVFDSAEFHQNTSFKDAAFNSNLSAEKCEFMKMADFSHAILMGGLWCPDCKMDHSIDLDPTRIFGRTVLS